MACGRLRTVIGWAEEAAARVGGEWDIWISSESAWVGGGDEGGGVEPGDGTVGGDKEEEEEEDNAG